MTADTIAKLLAGKDQNRPALGAPGAKSLTFGGLTALAHDVRSGLASAGVGRGDRVAIVLPNGPEMAAAFVTIAQAATTAPLNPAYRADEFEFYMSDLKAKALVTLQGFDTPARGVAEKLGTAIIGISSIHLLKTFISAGTLPDKTMLWQTVIHVVFLISAIAIALIDRLMTASAAMGKAHAGESRH